MGSCENHCFLIQTGESTFGATFKNLGYFLFQHLVALDERDKFNEDNRERGKWERERYWVECKWEICRVVVLRRFCRNCDGQEYFGSTRIFWLNNNKTNFKNRQLERRGRGGGGGAMLFPGLEFEFCFFHLQCPPSPSPTAIHCIKEKGGREYLQNEMAPR